MAPNKSRNRRTRVVPNRSYDHRPSSSMAGTRPSHFFKIILPSTIDDKKLVMPSPYLPCSLLVCLSFHFLNILVPLQLACSIVMMGCCSGALATCMQYCNDGLWFLFVFALGNVKKRVFHC